MIRVATWNTKQAVAPVLGAAAAWEWMEREIAPDLVVLTEAKVPRSGIPAGWVAEWEPDGFGPNRRWGTVVAATGDLSLRRVDAVEIGGRRLALEPTWPAAAITTDVFIGRHLWATVVGLYGFTVDLDGVSVGHGFFSVPQLLADLEPLLDSERGERLIVAGDLNLLPRDAVSIAEAFGLVDLIEWTGSDRSGPLPGCRMCDLGDDCRHLWTHRNRGGKNPSVQQIDYLFASKRIANEVDRVFGGYGDFPHADEASDHAPVVAEFPVR